MTSGTSRIVGTEAAVYFDQFVTSYEVFFWAESQREQT